MIRLALRHLGARKWQTGLTLGGILLGSAGFVVISGFMLGFRETLLDQLINNNAHVRITAREEFLTEHGLDRAFFPEDTHVAWISPPAGRKDSARIENPWGWMRRLEGDPEVASYSQQYRTSAILSRAKVTVNASLVGCDPERQVRLTNISESMTSGRFEDIGRGGNRLVVGDALLQKLGGRIGDTVLVTSGTQRPLPFRIVATYATGNRAVDEATAYTYITDAQKAAGHPNEINEIGVKLWNFEGARTYAGTLAGTSGDRVQSWDQLAESFLTIFKTQDMMRYLITVVILVVAAFGIYNILSMTVNQKRKEVAILRSMGYEGADVLRLFLTQGLFLGVVGGILGMGFGFVVCKYLATLPSPRTPIGGAATNLSISFDTAIYVTSALLALLSSSLASFFPAWNASKLNPIEIIRAGAE